MCVLTIKLVTDEHCLPSTSSSSSPEPSIRRRPGSPGDKDATSTTGPTAGPTTVKRSARANMTRFAAVKFPGNPKTVSKSQKIKLLPERAALNVEHRWKSSCLSFQSWSR